MQKQLKTNCEGKAALNGGKIISIEKERNVSRFRHGLLRLYIVEMRPVPDSALLQSLSFLISV